MEERNQLSMKPYLYNYFVKSKFVWLVWLVILSYVFQFLLVLENFNLVDLLSAVLPILIGIGLVQFYQNNKKCEYNEGSLKYISVSLKITWIVMIIALAILGFGMLAFLFVGQILALFVLLLTGGVVLVSILAYKTTMDAVQEISDCYKKNHIRVPSFEKAQQLWLVMGVMGAIAQGVTLLLGDKATEGTEQEKVIHLINLGSFSIVVKIITIVLGLALPFVLSYAFTKANQAFQEIAMEYEKELEREDQKRLEGFDFE